MDRTAAVIAKPLDLQGPRDTCKPGCDGFLIKWIGWYDRTFKTDPPALLPILDPAAYFALIGAKSRNMLRKAARHGYRFRAFERNDHLARIGEINRSKPVRSGGPMRPAYLDPPVPASPPEQLCQHHGHVWVGMFTAEQRLDAYAHLVFVNELAIVNTILAHAAAMPNGVSNAMIAALVDSLHHRQPTSPVRYLNYTTMTGPPSLVRFKKSVGFAATPIERTR